jgi:hypothetical protein
MSVELDGVNNILKTDTISEVTSANGVTIDGLSIKDSKLVTANSVIEANMSANSVDSDSYVDGSIDNAHIADDAIDIADGQITVGKLATTVFTGATDIGAAIVDADLFLMDDGAGGTIRKTTAARLKTYAGGGLAEADMWRINATVNMATAGANTDITASWERADTDGFAVLGTGLTESSGIFSFPSTGYWYINSSFYLNSDNAADNFTSIALFTTLDNSSYGAAGHSAGHFPATADNIQLSNSFILDVTNTTNVKFKWVYYAGATNNIIGDSGRQDSGFTCIKLADT